MTRESAYITFNPAGGQALRPILPDTCRPFAGKMGLPFFGDNKANGFWSQVGFDPGYGYLLLRKSDIDQIDFTSTSHSLTLTTGEHSVTISSLCAVHATAVFAVNADKADNLYLLYLEDLRRFGPWGSINRAFNVPTQRWTKSIPVDFYASTTNGGVEWTWSQIVDEVWGDVPSVLGALNKAAASFPSGSPSNLAFHGISPWDALKRICELTGHIFVLTRSGESKLIALADADATNEALFTANANRCLIPTREEWSTGVSLPEKVRVFFQSHNLAFQNSTDLLTVTELDYYKSAEDPDTPVTWRDVATNTITADPTVAGTIYPARSGVLARYDYDGTAENAAALTTEAASVAAKIINGLKRAAKPRHDLFHGPIAFQPGSTVHNIAWYDFGDGVRTEVTSNISPRKNGGGSAAPLLTPSHVSESAHAAVEVLAPPDLYRHHDPYPYVAIVETYEEIPAQSKGICRILYGINGDDDVTLSETSSLHEVTVYNTYDKVIPIETRIAVYFHRQTSRWLVLCEKADDIIRFRLQADLVTGGDALASRISYDGTDYIVEEDVKVFDWWGLTAQAPGLTRGMFQGVEGMEGWAKKREVPETLTEEEEELIEGDRPAEYDIIWMEQYAWGIEFTLTSSFTSNTATATVTASWHQGIAPGTTITVHDDQGRFPDSVSGCKGVAWRSEYADPNNPGTPYYKVVSCQRVAIFASATLSGDTCGSTMSISGFAIKAVGGFVASPPTTPTTVSNPCGHAGLNGDTLLLRRTNNTMPNPSWEVIDVSLHAKTVMIDVQVSGLTLQKKSVTAYVEVCDNTTPSWVTWHTGGECP